jgi:hypothetical protein
MSPQGNGLEATLSRLSQKQLTAIALRVTGKIEANEGGDKAVFSASANASNVVAFTTGATTTQNVAKAYQLSADTWNFGISSKGALFTLSSPATFGEDMADISREEIDAKLQNVELRAENRFVELSGKFDRIADSIATLSGTITRELEGVKEELVEVKADNKAGRRAVKEELAAVEADNKFSRLTIIATIVATAIAIIATIVGSVWGSLSVLSSTQSNLISAFQTGFSMKSEQQLSTPPTPPPSSPSKSKSKSN